MDQYLVASLALVAFSAFIVGAYIANEERKSRKTPSDNIHSYRDDLESRARRHQ
jgi:hypothetical protein